MDNMWVASNLIFALVIIYSNIKVFLFSYTHYWFTILTLILSIMSFFFMAALIMEWLPIYEYLENYSSYGSLDRMFRNPNTWTIFVFLIFTGFFF